MKMPEKQQSKKRSKKQQSGFTLIEMIVTMTIVAILASIAIPSFNKMIENNRISTGTNEFLAALILARSEAVKRSISVAVCTSDDQINCNSSSETEFSKGWIIFTDCDGDGALAAGAATCPDADGDGTLDAEQIIKVHEALPQLSIVAQPAGVPAITYDASGRSASLILAIGKDSVTPSKKINISRTGRVKSSKF